MRERFVTRMRRGRGATGWPRGILGTIFLTLWDMKTDVGRLGLWNNKTLVSFLCVSYCWPYSSFVWRKDRGHAVRWTCIHIYAYIYFNNYVDVPELVVLLQRNV